MMYFYLSVTFTANLYYKHISVHCILTVFILSINALFSIFYSFGTTIANSIGFRFIQFKYHTLYSKRKIILFSFFTHRDMSNIFSIFPYYITKNNSFQSKLPKTKTLNFSTIISTGIHH